jgi:hypothetical protein
MIHDVLDRRSEPKFGSNRSMSEPIAPNFGLARELARELVGVRA